MVRVARLVGVFALLCPFCSGGESLPTSLNQCESGRCELPLPIVDSLSSGVAPNGVSSRSGSSHLRTSGMVLHPRRFSYLRPRGRLLWRRPFRRPFRRAFPRW